MKKIILFMITFVIIGCSSTNLRESTNIDESSSEYAKVENYVCPMDTTFTAKFYKDYSKVDLETTADEIFTLMRVKMEDNKHYKDNEGRSLSIDAGKIIVEVVRNKPIICNVFGDK